MSDWLIVALIGLFLAVTVSAAARTLRRDQRGRTLVKHLQSEHNPLFCTYPYGAGYQITQINVTRERWKPYVIEVTRDALTIYDVTPEINRRFVLAPADLRWFGRPRKYTSGTNEIWLHAAIDGTWWLLRLRLPRAQMQGLVRALKEIATEEQITAYRRRRPYIHAGPVRAQPAEQDMLGMWTLHSAVTLYLTPLFLVVMRGATVQRTIELGQIQNVTAIKRLDRPNAAGLVRFDLADEQIAFALSQYRTFAGQLAEAARRTLEDPVKFQRKKKKPDDDVWDDDDEFYDNLEEVDMQSTSDGELYAATIDASYDDDDHQSFRINK